MNLDAGGQPTSLASNGTASRPVLPPLPRGFRPVRLKDLSHVRILAPGDHPVTRRRPRGSTASQRAGLAYQRKVCTELRRLLGGAALSVGPWIEYRAEAGLCYCQPDAIAVVQDRVYVFEMKLSTTTDAWWQLRHLYGPVVQYLYPSSRMILVNIVKSHYPEIRFPEDTWTFEIGLESLRERASVERIVQWRPGC